MSAATQPPASLGRRLAGMFYESLLLLGVISALVLIPHLLIGVIWQAALPGWTIWLNVAAAAGLYFVYQWHRSGQTLAMKTWRMQIVATSGGDGGQPPSIRRALLRYLLAWPSVLSGIGLLWALFDRDRQFLHDRLAGTRIVNVARPTTASSPPPAEK
ncbi:MAG: RDD family protein [Rhodocyclaceae bacterium]|nr:RDD family protein [Rhodocyclaceae bacterium]